MRIRKRRMRWGRSEIAQGVDQWIGIFLAIVICFFALQQSYGAQNMHDITQAEPDHLAVHTMERQQGSFLDILGRSELTQSEQARLTVSARITRLNAERNVILWAGLASGFAGNATRVEWCYCRSDIWVCDCTNDALTESTSRRPAYARLLDRAVRVWRAEKVALLGR